VGSNGLGHSKCVEAEFKMNSQVVLALALNIGGEPRVVGI
jgi:hypothetical protein